MSEDSGLGVSDNGQVCTDRKHHSGGEMHRRPPINMKEKVHTYMHTYTHIHTHTHTLCICMYRSI